MLRVHPFAVREFHAVVGSVGILHRVIGARENLLAEFAAVTPGEVGSVSRRRGPTRAAIAKRRPPAQCMPRGLV